MTDFPKVVNFNISVVIPVLNAHEFLPYLLKCIEAQSLLPKEIVIIDSSPSNKTKDIIQQWKGPLPIIYHKVDSAYPGHARNLGVVLANGEWIAFIDSRTLPDYNWLEVITSTVEQYQAEFVGALRTSDADTHFKQILRAATYGCNSIRSLAGSIVLKRIFERSGGFIPDVRAGEDLEWMHRLQCLGVKIHWLTFSVIKYNGLSESLLIAVKKWYTYSIANAILEVNNNQKKIYLVILSFAILFFVFKWNAIFAEWNEDNVYYIPNVTKIFMIFLSALYVFYRGIIRPMQVNVRLSFLLPWRWLEISFVGFCLDLSKAPGLIWGSILLLNRRLAAARIYFRTRMKPDV